MKKIRLFINGTIAELHKCSWPTKDELFQSTILVTVVLVIAGVFVSALDFVIRNSIDFITIG